MSRSQPSQWLGSGTFWMWVWLAALMTTAAWGTLTFVVPSLRGSVVNVAALSVFANVLAAASGVQATLTMRKADPEDPL